MEHIMEKYIRRGLFLVLLSLFCASQSARSQEYFRELDTSSQLPLVNQPEPQGEDKYNLSVGPIRLNVAAGVALEFNDNIRLSPNDEKISDLIFRPSVSLEGRWKLSDLNTLRISIGASYAKYFSHSEFDSRSLLLSPNSALSFTIRIGEALLTISERFSYQEDPFDLPVISGTGNFRRFENRIGAQLDWALTPTFTLTTGYVHYNLRTFDTKFESLDRSIDTFYVRPAFAVSPTVAAGLNASVNFISFTKSTHSDSRSYLIGPFVDWAITPYTHAAAEVGYQKFDSATSDVFQDNGSVGSVYARVSITNLLSESFRHRLSFTKTNEIGFETSTFDLYHVEYGADWAIHKDVSLEPTIFYEHYSTSGNPKEKADRVGAAVGLRYLFTPSVTLGLDYRYLVKNSNLFNSDYQQNLVLLSLFYNF
jgi:hypothetical protein